MTTEIQKRHIEVLAGAILRARIADPDDMALAIASEWATQLRKYNSRFDAGRFFRMCGYPPSVSPVSPLTAPAYSVDPVACTEARVQVARAILNQVPATAGIGGRELTRRICTVLTDDYAEGVRFWLRKAVHRDGTLNTDHLLAEYVATLKPLTFASAF